MQAPPVIAPEQRPANRWLAALLAGIILAIAAILYCFNPSHYGFYPHCQLYLATGIYCPGCGSLRAMHFLAHGQILLALHSNAVLVLSLPWVLIYFLRCARSWLRNQPLPSINLSPTALKLGIGLLLIFTILRNIHTAPFFYLAPL